MIYLTMRFELSCVYLPRFYSAVTSLPTSIPSRPPWSSGSKFNIGPKILGFEHGGGRWILRPITIPSTISFGGEVKSSVPCHNIYGTLKNPISMKKILHRQNLAANSCQVSHASPIDVSLWATARSFIERMIRKNMGTHGWSRHDSPCVLNEERVLPLQRTIAEFHIWFLRPGR
jgi:hypothetical protein